MEPRKPEIEIAGEVLRLSNQQRVLRRALSEIDRRLAQMYVGTLEVLYSDNVNKYALAAHGLRELIEKLPQYLGLRTDAHNEQLSNKVRDLQPAWKQALDRSPCATDGRWSGSIDSTLRKFLKSSRTFFQWFDENMPRRRDEVAELINALDPNRGNLPAELANNHVKRMQLMRQYFVQIAHHRESATEGEFVRWLNEFEVFLLDRLVPRTFEDVEELDGLIARGEGQ